MHDIVFVYLFEIVSAEIFQKVCEDIYCSLEKTKKTLNGDTLEKCCQAILNSNNILVFGLGNSASIAIDASHKMFRLGLNVHAYIDNHLQAIAAAHTDQNSVIIGISHSGRSKDIIQAMETAKLNGATTIAITNLEKSPIDKTSDLILHTVSDETNYRILGLCDHRHRLFLYCLPFAERKRTNCQNGIGVKAQKSIVKIVLHFF